MRTLRILAIALVAAGGSFASRAEAQVVARAAVTGQAAQTLQLERAWMTQAAVDPTRGVLAGLSLHKGILFVSTQQGLVQAIDAETGVIYWTTQVGNSRSITLAPGANDNYCVLTNGTHLFALERRTGRLAFERRTKNGASAGPALSDKLAYVPMYNGSIEVYHLRDTNELDKEPSVFFAAGASLAPPIIKGERLYWTTKGGFLYGDDDTSSDTRFRYQTGGLVLGGAAVFKPVKGVTVALAGSLDGSVYAVTDPDGILLWRYQAGAGVAHAPVVVSDAVYVVNDAGVLSRVDVQTGVARWQAQGVKRFLSASPTRVYTIDALGQVLVFDALHGGLIGSMFAGAVSVPFINDQTDRAYLVSTNGLIQCLHERALVKPHVHMPPAPPVTAPPMTTPPADGTAPSETPASPF